MNGKPDIKPTMTAGEVIERLSEFHKDTPVFVEWEGQTVRLKPDLFLTRNNSIIIWADDI